VLFDFPDAEVKKFILIAIFFILDDSFKYDGDIFFILGENKLLQRSVERSSLRREKIYSGCSELLLWSCGVFLFMT